MFIRFDRMYDRHTDKEDTQTPHDDIATRGKNQI